jgi:hypothetical protein
MRIRHTISEMKKSRIGIHPKLKQKSNPFPLSPAFSDTCERAVFFGAIHANLTNRRRDRALVASRSPSRALAQRDRCLSARRIGDPTSLS